MKIVITGRRAMGPGTVTRTVQLPDEIDKVTVHVDGTGWGLYYYGPRTDDIDVVLVNHLQTEIYAQPGNGGEVAAA